MLERSESRLVPAVIASISAFVLLSAFHLWRFAGFSLDDFNNLYWARGESLMQILRHNIDPASTFFRPFGMLFYAIGWRLFDLNPLPYHLFAWALHAANVFLMYVLLSRIAGSSYAAAAGAMLFGFRSNFSDIYWNFGTIFELLACGLMLVALLVHRTQPKSYRNIVLVCVIYVLAIKSKEMAITLPAVLLIHDWCFRERLDRMRIFGYACLAAIGLWFAYLKVSIMASTSITDPYYMDVSVLTFGRGYGWYFDRLYGMSLRWGAWMIAAAVSLGVMAYKRENRGVFFAAYTFITLLPVVFLVNHRFEFYWYIPFFGIGGLAAVLCDAIQQRLRRRVPAKALASFGVLGFVLLGAQHYSREKRVSAAYVEDRRSLSAEYSAFVQAVRALPQPPANETVYYKSFPRHLDSFSLMAATQLALGRTDVRVEVVDVFPYPCGYCLSFENGVLVRKPGS